PITQLFRIGLGIDSARATSAIEQEHLNAQRLSVTNSVKRLYFAILQSESALDSTEQAIALYRELDRTLEVRVAQKVALRADSLDVRFRLAKEELTRSSRGAAQSGAGGSGSTAEEGRSDPGAERRRLLQLVLQHRRDAHQPG